LLTKVSEVDRMFLEVGTSKTASKNGILVPLLGGTASL